MMDRGSDRCLSITQRRTHVAISHEGQPVCGDPWLMGWLFSARASAGLSGTRWHGTPETEKSQRSSYGCWMATAWESIGMNDRVDMLSVGARLSWPMVLMLSSAIGSTS